MAPLIRINYGAGDGSEIINFKRSRSAPTLAGKASLYPVGSQFIRVTEAPVLPIFAGSPSKGVKRYENQKPSFYKEETAIKCTITTWEAYFSCINLYVGLS